MSKEKGWVIATDLGCHYGVLQPTKRDAIAAFMDGEEMEDATWRQMYAFGYRAVRCTVEYQL